MLQVGARNMQNYDLLRQLQIRQADPASAPFRQRKRMASAAEYLLAGGNPTVGSVSRHQTFEAR